jgi:hypothetical protein
MRTPLSNSVMAKSDPTKDPEFKRVLGNLLSAPPKPHSEMKVGKKKKSSSKAAKKRKLA